MRKAGRIYEAEDGKWVTAMHDDQDPEFYRQGKVYIEEFIPANTLFPEMNEEKGTVKKVLKDLKKLKLVGFIN